MVASEDDDSNQLTDASLAYLDAHLQDQPPPCANLAKHGMEEGQGQYQDRGHEVLGGNKTFPIYQRTSVANELRNDGATNEFMVTKTPLYVCQQICMVLGAKESTMYWPRAVVSERPDEEDSTAAVELYPTGSNVDREGAGSGSTGLADGQQALVLPMAAENAFGIHSDVQYRQARKLYRKAEGAQAQEDDEELIGEVRSRRSKDSQRRSKQRLYKTSRKISGQERGRSGHTKERLPTQPKS